MGNSPLESCESDVTLFPGLNGSLAWWWWWGHEPHGQLLVAFQADVNVIHYQE